MVFLLLVLQVLTASTLEEEIAELHGEPDIWSITLAEYVGDASNNLEMKMLTMIYIDSLEVNLERSFHELRDSYSDAPEMQEYLDQAHESFLEWVGAWAIATEERMWWHDGVRYDGTARGDMYGWTLAKWYWQRIVAYRRWLRIEGVWQEELEPGDLGCESLGGYLP